MHVVAFAPVSGHHLIAWLFIGLVAGALAGIVVRGGGLGFVRDIIVGLIGAVIGGLILHAARGGSHTVVKLWQEIVVAFVGAVILLLVIRVFTRGGRTRARR
ncbi:MAG: GlsB/YeaQ/YmgE family stress response membrane protein [Actinomycetota bacterium]|nr:GlsB/YeaQ/YmgE family stress response membrane protein [Actinomycetota bacterium]